MALLAKQPFHLMIKPAGAACNLACEYCYYLEKASFYPGRRLRMEDATLERVTAAYLQTNPGQEVVFGWQGGEPLLMGVDFFRRALELQAHYARSGQRVLNALQTNATLVDDEWAAFFAEHGFLIGVSMDGPPELHDRYRRDREGHPSHARVVAGLEKLLAHKVEVNALVTVNRANADHPLRVYQYLTGLGFEHLQFIPIVERDKGTNRPTAWSARPESYGKFLCEIFDYWARHDVGRVFVQLFESALSVWLGRPPAICVFQPTCGWALAVEHTGELYACDHYVFPDYLRGPITPENLKALLESPEQQAFGRAKADLSADCRRCPVLRLCNGDCPKHRLRPPAGDDKPISHLCPAYQRFFTHSAEILGAMATEIRANRPATNVMEMLQLLGR